MKKQMKTRALELDAMVVAKAFRRGYEDRAQNLGFPPDYENANPRWQESYERGRLFYLASPGLNLPSMRRNVSGRITRLAECAVADGILI